MSIEERLVSLGITLPTPAKAVANYVPYVLSNGLLSISGQLPMGANGLVYEGIVGGDVSIENATEAARLCGINIIAQAKAACGGDLSRVKQIVKLGGFVAGVNGFSDQPKIINGASDLMVEIFGDAGRHSRSAVGVSGLPLGAPVEIDALIEIT